MENIETAIGPNYSMFSHFSIGTFYQYIASIKDNISFMKWRKLGSGEQISLTDYLKSWLSENQDQSKGGHVIYSRLVTPKMTSKHERLWKEVELSVETAQIIMDSGIQKPDYIDIDLNPDPRYQSNSLLRAAVGLIESMGIEARYKTLSPWAISIADTLCK